MPLPMNGRKGSRPSRAARLLRGLAAVAAGAGLAVAALGLGGAESSVALAEDPAPYWNVGEIPEYPGGLESPLGDELSVNGISLKMSYFSTRDTAEKVRDHYLSTFERAGLAPEVAEAADGYTVVAMGLDPPAQLVVPIVRRQSSTEVFPSLIPLDVEVVDPSASLVEELPMSDSAIGVTRVASGGEGAGLVVNWIEPLDVAGSVATRIRDEMGKRGWALESFTLPMGRKTGAVEVAQGSRSMRFTVTPLPMGAGGASVTALLAPGGE